MRFNKDTYREFTRTGTL